MVDETKQKKGEEICFFCNKIIKIKKEKYVSLQTFEKSKIIEIEFFHIKCFGEYFNSKVKEKAENMVKKAHSKAVEIFTSVINDATSFLGLKNSNKFFDIEVDGENKKNGKKI